MPYLFAVVAIVLWSSLALLATQLNEVPAFLVLGITLLLGGSLSALHWRSWHLQWSTLRMGVFGIFGYHFTLFLALRYAPPVEANLLNYLWPLLIVLLSPLYLSQVRLNYRHWVGGALGFSGAALVISGGQSLNFDPDHLLGYLLAVIASLIWARYSLLTRRSGDFSSATVGLFCLITGVLSLLCHWLLETTPSLNSEQWLQLALLGLGPLGISFYCWDAAMKRGDPRTIGALAYFTPLLSTAMLITFGAGELKLTVVLALALISGGALLGVYANRFQPKSQPANANP